MPQQKKKKEEIEELLNKVFGVNVRWSKLSLEELTQIVTVLTNPHSLIKRLQTLAGYTPESEFVEALKKIVTNIKHEGPVINLLRMLLGVKHEREEEK